MKFRNYTPFPPILFENLHPCGDRFQVVALKGTFRIVKNGPIKPIPQQDPPNTTDRFRGEINLSSIVMDSDLASFKPRTDVHIEANAHSPSGKDRKDWLVRAQIGNIDKTLRVTGKRSWSYSAFGGWQLSSPQPCTEVPIQYENAFGGIHYGKNDEQSVFEQNPVGCGYRVLRRQNLPIDPYQEIKAPQIENPEEPIVEFGKVYRPQGFGPIARSWLPRRKFAGTYDEQWREHRYPNVPEDFQFDFYNSAHPEFVYPEVMQGDEEVYLYGLSPHGSLSFRLPGYQIALLVTDSSKQKRAKLCSLDTVRIDVPRDRVHLTWRSYFPLYDERLTSVEAHMDFEEA